MTSESESNGMVDLATSGIVCNILGHWSLYTALLDTRILGELVLLQVAQGTYAYMERLVVQRFWFVSLNLNCGLVSIGT